MPPMMPPGASPEQPPAGPTAAPMSGPTEQEGLKAQAAQSLQLAIKLCDAAMMAFGSTSDEGKKIYTAVRALEKVAGPGGGPDMNSSQVKMLAAQAGPENTPAPPQAGGAPPGGGMPMMGPQPRPF